MLVFLRFNTLKNFVRQWEDNIFIVHHIISFWLDFGCLVSANFWLPSIWLLRNTGKACRTWRQYQGRWCQCHVVYDCCAMISVLTLNHSSGGDTAANTCYRRASCCSWILVFIFIFQRNTLAAWGGTNLITSFRTTTTSWPRAVAGWPGQPRTVTVMASSDLGMMDMVARIAE